MMSSSPPIDPLPPFSSLPDLIPSLPSDIALLCLLRVPSDSHPSLRSVCSSWRSTVSHPHFSLLRRRLGFLRRSACLLQAAPPPSSPDRKAPTYSISVYDASDSSWHHLPPIPDFAHHGLPLFCQCVAAGPYAVVLGGWDPISWSVLTSVYIYSFADASWRRGADMPSARSFFAAASFGDDADSPFILVAGGHDHDKNALRSAHLYSLHLDSWRTLPDMAHQRDECSAVAVAGGRVAVISGFSTESQGVFGVSAEVYDADADKWELLPEMWPAGRSPASVMSVKGEIYAIIDGNLSVFRRKQQQKNEEQEDGMRGWAWQTLAPVPAELKAASAAAFVGEDHVVVSGYSGGADRPYEVFQRRLSGAAASPWRRVEASDAFCGLVQSACTVEL